jgi:hypothetical protein
LTLSPRPAQARIATSCLLIVLVCASIAAILLALLVVLDPRQWSAPAAPTPTIKATTPAPVIANRATDVPTVTLVPPTATLTLTPTETPIPPTATPITPTETPIPPTVTPVPPTATRRPPPTAVVRRCVSVVGDSVAHGDAVYEIPGVGYLQAQLAPVSAFIEYQYRQHGVGDMQVLNRTSSAVGISSGNHPSYFGTVEYAQLLQDGCQYTVIIPWLNDLSSGVDGGVAAPAHVSALATLVQALVGKNPTGKILIVNYYQGAAAPFAARTFASGFTPGNVAAFNQQIAAACAGGALARPQVKCVDANAALGGMGLAAVVGPASQQDLSTLLIAPPSQDQANQVSFYFSNNPGGALTGDGVHLSNSGKAQLAAYLVGLMP